MEKIFKILIIVWIVIAVVNVFYNLVKTIPEYKEWALISDSQKRHKIFGDYYDFLVLISNHTQRNEHILIYSKNGDQYGTFFQSLYYLYPRRIVTTVNKKEFTEKTNSNSFTYVATFDSSIFSEDYEKVASFSSKTTTHFGTLYKSK